MNIDIEKTFQKLTYFTNGDNLLDGHLIYDAIENVIYNNSLKFSINYESGKQNSRRFYEIMSINYSENGEYGIDDFVLCEVDLKDNRILELEAIIEEKDFLLSEANKIISDLNSKLEFIEKYGPDSLS